MGQQNSGSEPKLSRAETMPALHGNNRIDPGSNPSGKSPNASSTSSGGGRSSPLRRTRMNRGSSQTYLNSDGSQKMRSKVSGKRPRAIGDLPSMRPQRSGTVFERRR